MDDLEDAEEWLDQASLKEEHPLDVAPMAAPPSPPSRAIKPEPKDDAVELPHPVKAEPEEDAAPSAPPASVGTPVADSQPQAAPPSRIPPLSTAPPPEVPPAPPRSSLPPDHSSVPPHPTPPRSGTRQLPRRYELLISNLVSTVRTSEVLELVEFAINRTLLIEPVLQRSTTSPPSIDAIVELKSEDELSSAASALNGTVFQGQRIETSVYDAVVASNSAKKDVSHRGRSRSPIRRSSPPPSTRSGRRRSASPSRRRSASPRRPSLSRHPSSQSSQPDKAPSRYRRRSTTPPNRHAVPVDASTATHPWLSANTWICVNGVPLDSSEYHLFSLLRNSRIDTTHIHLAMHKSKPSRYAFVGLKCRSDNPEALRILSRDLPNGERQHATGFARGSSSDQPVFNTLDMLPYLGPSENARQAPAHHRAVVVAHLPPRITKTTIYDFFVNELGRGKINTVEIVASPFRGCDLAIAVFYHHADAQEAILKCDGQEIDGRAVGVNWSPKNEPSCSYFFPFPLVFSLLTVCPPAASLSSHPLSTTRSRYRDPSKQLSPSPIDSTKSSHTVAPPSPPPAAVSSATPLSLDLQRLRSIDLPEQLIEGVQRVWDPLDDSSRKDRSLSVDVDFGFLPKRDAKAALDAMAEQPLFPDDVGKQKMYECFLKANAGESRDWYTVRPSFSLLLSSALLIRNSSADLLRQTRRVQPHRLRIRRHGSPASFDLLPLFLTVPPFFSLNPSPLPRLPA